MIKLKSKSFTLVEVLVATGILVLMIGAASSAEAMYLRSGDTIKHTIQANGLAEEGLNLVKVVRDRNLFRGQDPFTNFSVLPKCKVYQFEYNDSTTLNPTGFISGSENITLPGDTMRFTRKIFISNSDQTCP